MNYIKHNNQKITSRLIFFAKATEAEQKSYLRLLTKEQERHCEELETMAGIPQAKEIAQQFRKGKIDMDTFDEAGYVLRDPNKMAKDEYKNFMKALAKGKFPKKGENAGRFLTALKGGKEESAYAKNILKDLSKESTGPLAERKEKEHLKKLTDFRAKTIVEEVEKETEVGETAIIAKSGALGVIKEAMEAKEKHWAIEKAPEELVEKLDRLEMKQAGIAKKSNELDQKIREIEALPTKERDKELLKKLDNERLELDKEFDKLQAELSKPREKFTTYLLRNAKRFEHLESFFQRAGIDMDTAEKIKMWCLELTSRGSEMGKPTLKLGGVIINPKTGKAQKKETFMKITGIHFERGKTDVAPEAAGELMIEYRNEIGEKSVASYKVFLNMVDAYEAYEEIKSFADLNEKIADEAGYADLSEGQEFETETTIGFDEKGNEVRETRIFSIQSIDQEKGTITLDKNVTKIPRQWIGFSVHPALYFDRKQQEFSFGEFAKFVKQHKYERKIAIDEMEKVLAKTAEAQRKMNKSFVEDASDSVKTKFAKITADIAAEKISPPSAGESANVIFLDDFRRREGKLSRETDENGEEVYFLEEIPQAPGTLDALIDGGVPLSIAAAKPAKDRWKKRKLDARALQAMANKGDITDAPSEAEFTEDDTMEAEPTAPGARRAPTAPTAPTAEGEAQALKEKKAKIYNEALPYDAIYKTGGMTHKQEGFLKAFWTQTRFLSVDDFWEWGKVLWDYYKRRFERRQKERYSSVGQDLPFFAPEMKRINQATENEQVNQFKESFVQMGVFQIQGRLQKTNNRDELKAAFITLTEKGQLRWDDIDMWKNLNRFVGAGVAIPIPSNGDPSTRQSDKDPRTGFDFLKGAIDSLWGEGGYDDWANKNKGSYQSSARNYFEEGKQLEGVDGGHGRRLAVLLQQHKRGEFVSPHEYEGLILHAIDAGKSSMQNKLYYMIEGVAATNIDGRTILSFDRMAHLNSEMLQKFPILEYLCASITRPDGKKHKFTIDDYKRWAGWFDEGDPMNPARCTPGAKVDEFMWKYVIPSDETQNRINKAMRNGENFDHDDMFAYLPPASEQVVTDACKATTGAKKFLTIEGYANVLPGFSQYMRSLAENNNRNKLREAVVSYVRFEGIMKDRFEKEDTKTYQRMDHATLRGETIVSNTPPQAFINEMNGMVKGIVIAYDDEDLTKLADLIYTETGDVFRDKNAMNKQKEINDAFRRFSDVFNRVIKSDNGEKMRSVVERTNLEGMPFGMSDEEKAKRKAKYTDSLELE